MGLSLTPTLRETARHLRGRQTDAEAHLWAWLRDRQIHGLKFRRQHPIGPYVVDFCCVEHHLVVEVDGGHHGQPNSDDQHRTGKLAALGYRVIRFWNHDVLQHREAVLDAIRHSPADPLPRPLPERERGRITNSLWLALAAGLSLAVLTACASAPKKDIDLVWPLPPEAPRIKFVKSLSSSADVRPTSFAQRLKTTIIGNEQTAGLGKPYAVHVDRKGRIFVADSAWRKVLVFDETGKDFFILGTDGPGLLLNPRGVTSDADGRVYVTDVTQNRVVVYDEKGEFVLAMGLRGQLDKPVGVAVNDALKRVYVVSTGSTATQSHKVTVFDATNGNLLFEFGGRGIDDGKLNFPTNIVADAAGKIYVMDSFNFRVQIFDADGKFLSKFGGIGTGFGQFSKPKGIGVDSEGHIYVSDAAFNNVQIFDQEGRLLLFFGEMGSRRGQFWLPAGLAVDANNRIYVADQYNKRINIYQYLSETDRTSGEGPRTDNPSATN